GNMADSVVIAIGASTGGTEATLEIVKNFPKDTPGMIVVQHMPPGFTKMYADRLDRICKMEVREAANGDEIRTGCILIAPGDYHMTVQKSGTKYTVRCFGGEKVSGHRPSVDVLFDSVADQVKSKAIGVILTGMGRDGASGLLKMRKAGAFTIGQNEESCVVYGMPMVAYEIGAVATQASLEKIPDVIAEGLRKKA
ncbi:MAG: CheB methylesterase domain-containing protein, partial [Oscillospiraceae bacterium]|nr:CheB methylesterase domain-containing protein [Oscillospiraceae bacterium]